MQVRDCDNCGYQGLDEGIVWAPTLTCLQCSQCALLAFRRGPQLLQLCSRFRQECGKRPQVRLRWGLQHVQSRTNRSLDRPIICCARLALSSRSVHRMGHLLAMRLRGGGASRVDLWFVP